MSQRDGEPKMRNRKNSVAGGGPAQPVNRLLVIAKRNFGVTQERKPYVGESIARTEAQRLVNMWLRFIGSADKNLGEPNECLRVRKISVQACGPLEGGDGLVRLPGQNKQR